MSQQEILDLLKKKASKKDPKSAKEINEVLGHSQGRVNKALKMMRKYKEIRFKLERKEYSNNRNLVTYVYWTE